MANLILLDPDRSRAKASKMIEDGAPHSAQTNDQNFCVTHDLPLVGRCLSRALYHDLRLSPGRKILVVS